jgi:hypothetical protein
MRAGFVTATDAGVAATKQALCRTSMPSLKVQAALILRAFHDAESALLGKAVVLSDGKAGTVEKICLDELHGLRIEVSGHEGKWPVSTIKFLQS